jgi:hypothetical protein
MDVPEGVLRDLQGVRSTFRLVWNPKGRVIGERSFDVNGHPRELTYDPRWELWDTDAHGAHYKVMTLESEQGGFLAADQRFVEFVRLIDPARYGGSVERMIQALVDDENRYVEQLAQKDWENLVDSVARYFTPAKGRGIVTVG